MHEINKNEDTKRNAFFNVYSKLLRVWAWETLQHGFPPCTEDNVCTGERGGSTARTRKTDKGEDVRGNKLFAGKLFIVGHVSLQDLCYRAKHTLEPFLVQFCQLGGPLGGYSCCTRFVLQESDFPKVF